MTDKFDFDDLLDDVLNDTVTKQDDDSLDSLMDELLPESSSTHLQPTLKYMQLSLLPFETRKEWERILGEDEAVMKTKNNRPLSYAYLGIVDEFKTISLKDLLKSLLSSVVTDDDNGKNTMTEMCNDSELIQLFCMELKKKIRKIIHQGDSDVSHGDFTFLKCII